MSKVELYKDVKNSLGEGITWSSIDQSLLWVDIKPKSVLFRINLDNEKLETFDLPDFVTATSIISKNEIALVSNNGVNKFNFQSKKYERIINVEDDILTNRSNDGASDARGRLWFGTMQNNFNQDGSAKSLNAKSGSLYCLSNNKVNIVETSTGVFQFNSTDTNTNYFLNGISKSGNTLTFSVSGATNQSYTFGSNAFTSTTIPSAANNGEVTLSAGSGLTGGAAFTVDQSHDETITFNVGAGTGITVNANDVALSPAGAGAGTYGSTADATKIDQITLDAYGRVTAVSTGPISVNAGDITNVTAGTGLSGGGSSGSVSLAVDLSELTDMTQTITTSDEFIVLDNGADRRKAISEVINDLNIMTGNVTGTLLAEVIVANSIETDMLKANTITTAKLSADIITATQLEISNNSAGSAGIFFDVNGGNARIDIRDSSTVRVRIGYLA